NQGDERSLSSPGAGRDRSRKRPRRRRRQLLRRVLRRPPPQRQHRRCCPPGRGTRTTALRTTGGRPIAAPSSFSSSPSSSMCGRRCRRATGRERRERRGSWAGGRQAVLRLGFSFGRAAVGDGGEGLDRRRAVPSRTPHVRRNTLSGLRWDPARPLCDGPPEEGRVDRAGSPARRLPRGAVQMAAPSAAGGRRSGRFRGTILDACARFTASASTTTIIVTIIIGYCCILTFGGGDSKARQAGPRKKLHLV
ncbi:unnamed protein product, partial [Scytosiphon promiscuus]